MAEDGRWTPIAATSPYAEELGRFAVDEHNRLENKHLIYRTVAQASVFKVNSVNLTDIHLIIKAADPNVEHKYDAIINEDPCKSISRTLTHFTKL